MSISSFSFVVVAAAAAAALSACAAPLALPAVRAESESPVLRREAAAVFPSGEGAEPLHLRENIFENIESVAADGTANAYKINYVLFFEWRGKSEKITLEQIVSVDESRYLAGIRARAEAAERLRLEALRRARYILAKLK